MITLEQQIAEVERELAQRVWVYPAQVAAGRLKQRDADYRRKAMLAVLATLKDLQARFATVAALDELKAQLQRREEGK